MEELFLPVLHSFENGNVFTGSLGLLRFKITPQITMKTPKEVDFEASSIRAEYWHGLCCYEKSQIEGEAVQSAPRADAEKKLGQIFGAFGRENVEVTEQ